MKKILLFSAVLCFSTSISYADNTSEVKSASDYPTQARVEYVFQCMHKYDTKDSYDTMYGCVCAVDKLAEAIPYDNFVATSTLAVMINTPGEKGGVFRDAPGGRKAIREFKKFIADTEQSCGLRIKKKT
jgi:hypothetical protein